MSLIRAKLVGDVVSGSTFAGIVTATGFDGDLTGNVTGDVTGNVSGNATVGILTATTISIGDSTGQAGQYLQSTGVGVTWADIDIPEGGLSVFDSNVIGFNAAGIRSDSANGRLEVFGTGNFRVYETPGTFTVNPGISSIRVRVIGSGGNGSAGRPPFFSGFPPTVLPGCGGGGGGGGYAHKVISSFPAPRTYAVTVGTPGGGSSSFGSEVSATGGSNASGTPGGVGGNGINGDVNYSGAPGFAGAVAIPGAPSPTFPNPANPLSVYRGYGGSAGTQLGNAPNTLAYVPGIPNFRFPSKGYSVRRFPFDTFEGYNARGTVGGVDGAFISYPVSSYDGYEGGTGDIGVAAGPSVTSNGGAGGVGAGGARGTDGAITSGAGGAGGIGGGGGGGGAQLLGIPPGGAGGPGIVIVEW